MEYSGWYSIPIHRVHYQVINMVTTSEPAPITIKLFQFIRTHYQTTRMYSSQTNSNCLLNINITFVFIFLYFIQILIASIAYLLFKAESIGDLAYSYLVSLSIILTIFFLVIHSLKASNILMLIEKYDEFIRKSELK